MITYPKILESDNLTDIIDKDYISLDSNLFNHAERYFNSGGKHAEKYCPVLNGKGQIECFAYNDCTAVADEILSLIQAVEVDNIMDGLLPEGYKGINIWGINQIGFSIAKALRENSEIPFAVVGEYWKELGFECDGNIIEHGYDIYVEGNRAIPISQLGKWRRDCPIEWNGLKTWLQKYIDNILVKDILPDTKTLEWLYNKLVSGEAFMAARLGVTEGRLIVEYLNGNYTKERMRWLYTTSGFFSEKGVDFHDVNEFAKREIEAVKDTDLHMYMDWASAGVIKRFAGNDSKICKFGSVLHEDNDVSWVQGLKGKRVLVISPFDETVKMQYDKKDKLHSGNKRLPEFELIPFKMIETQNGVKCGFSNFLEAYDYVIGQIKKIDFDVALIAAGAYGYLLAHDIKRMGKASIELCSYLMPIFGIKIKRHSVQSWVNAYWNEYWSFPVEQPVKDAQKIENGCYWA